MGLITLERRALLRRLRIEFEAAFAQVTSTDRVDASYLLAEQAYKEWRRGIDADALDLLDDLDAAEAELVYLRDALLELKPARAPKLKGSTEIDDPFEEIERTLMIQNALGAGDDCDVDSERDHLGRVEKEE